MAKEWIEELAEQIRQKNREAAEKYGRDQHYAGVIASLGKEYFVRLATELREDVETLRRQLQGDATAAETAVETIRAGEVKIRRARFPWVEAVLRHRDETILLEYAKEPGTRPSLGGDAAAELKTRSFAFRVAPDDSLYVEEAFADAPRRYEQPEALAREIVEILFAV